MILEIKENTIYALLGEVKYRYNKAGLLDFWCEDPCHDWKFVEDHNKRNEIINEIMYLVAQLN